MKIVAIVQARIGSTRLPGKVLMNLMDKSVLAHVINRLQSVSIIDEIIVATTDKSIDETIVNEAKKCGTYVYRGSEEDVLSRYYESAKMVQADVIVRVTSDCPLLDPDVTADIIDFFMKQNVEYASNTVQRTFPRGLDVEVFTMKALEQAFFQAKQPAEREHVTPYLYQHSEKFQLATYIGETDYSQYRLTLDTLEDWKLIDEIYQKLYQPNKIFSWTEVIRLLQEQPYLVKINAHVEQKKLGGLRL